MYKVDINIRGFYFDVVVFYFSLPCGIIRYCIALFHCTISSIKIRIFSCIFSGIFKKADGTLFVFVAVQSFIFSVSIVTAQIVGGQSVQSLGHLVRLKMRVVE